MNFLYVLNIILGVNLLIFEFSKRQFQQSGNEDTSKTNYKFDFGPGKIENDYTQVTYDMIYNKERCFGFYNNSTIKSITRTSDNALYSDFCTSNKPFIFIVDVAEGNYNVKIIIGDLEGDSYTTIKAEARRLIYEKIHTSFGEIKTLMFTTNVRCKKINANEEVKLKSREYGHPDWDERLSIEFNNSKPCICALEITKTNDAITLYLAGNSTVTDQQNEPWAAWGQMLPCFFEPGKISVANHAESGETLKSFIAENRLKKILTTIKPGDYLFIQFGHNDQKPENSTYVEPYTGYKEYLKLYIKKAREYGAIPVLITPMHRRKFDEKGNIINTHGDYPEAMREVADEENIALIDLHAMSTILFESMGIGNSKKAFVHYPAGTFPGQNEKLEDNSHFSNYGAYQLAKCIIKGIKENNLEIAKYLKDDLSKFDPANPDPLKEWELPVSPLIEIIKDNLN